MRLIFAGTPEFASAALDAIVAAGHEVALVLTRADKPAGRGQKLMPSPVKQRALALGLPVQQPSTLRDPGAAPALAAIQPEAMVVAAYGMILPPAVLAVPTRGCLNIHASLLPRWRGAAPIQRAIEAGDPVTGITIMQMDTGLDTGDMLLAESLPILPEDHAGSLHDRLAALGARLIVRALDDLAAGRLVATPQPAEGVTYAHKILKTEAPLDWSQPAPRLADRIRAFDPFPGCTAVLAGSAEPIKIWRARALAEPAPAGAPPGSLLPVADGRVRVVCAHNSLLELLEVQRPGARRVGAMPWRQSLPPDAALAFQPASPR
ncbi:MAG: methionyl-tRNA formyltransferase [Betaproteobacteria bacterium]|nr:methionyl-tRNA formyltransferase [Betaproteobacteria bacterium]